MGGILLLLGLPFVLAPAGARFVALAFPRSRPAAYGLTGLALGWSAWIVLQAPLGRFDAWKPGLYVLTPVLFYMLVAYLDELLAARALGGVLLLAANPAFYAARLWEGESALRYVIPVMAYVVVIAGTILVMSPYLLRRGLLAVAGTDARGRITGALLVLLGGFIVALGAKVY